MTDLTEFFAARLDETEADAKARRGIFPNPGVEDSGAVWLHIKRGGNAVVTHYLQPAEGYGDMADLRAWAGTEQGWTQARVLREVEADRALLAKLRQVEELGEHLRADTEILILILRQVIAIRAAIWNDHPDYEGWLS